MHLLMQFTNAPSSCTMLIFYLFDIKRRHQNIRGMSAKVKGDAIAFQNFVSQFLSPDFQDRLRHAVTKPEGKDAKYVLNKLMSVLNTAARILFLDH